MRAGLLILSIFGFAVIGAEAHADALSDEFKTRIEAALAKDDESERIVAVGDLFHQDDIDEYTAGMIDQVIGIVIKLRGHDITFEPLPPDIELLYVIDGYEHRPNVAPLGRVVFTDPAAAPGNDTKVLYGRHPTDQRLLFPLTTRVLVNPDAPPDKQLQMIAIGLAFPPSTFEGWCDIALSNNTTKRIKLHDQGVGNQTMILGGQSIEACELTNTSDDGTLSLRLYEDDREIFIQRIEAPETTITYHKP